jgi:hypothetical protein
MATKWEGRSGTHDAFLIGPGGRRPIQTVIRMVSQRPQILGFGEEANMNKLVIILVLVFVLFTIINAYTAPVNLLQFANDRNNFGIGLGLIELVDADKQAYNVFPFHFYIKSEERSVFLLFNMLTIVFKSGINYSKPVMVSGNYSGDIVSVGGQVIVSGRVSGDIWAFNADVVLKSGASVSGNVVAIGGRVNGAAVGGTKLVASNLQFPLMGIVISPQTGDVFQLFGFDLFAVLFFLIILVLYALFGKGHLSSLAGAVTEDWKGSLLFTILSLLCIPVILILLIASKAGLLIVPLVIIFLLAAGYAGYVSLAVRLGRIIVRGEGGNPGQLILAGAVGFVLIHGLTVIGLILSLFSVNFMKVVATIFLTVGAIVSYCAYIYGLGISLARLKNRTA